MNCNIWEQRCKLTIPKGNELCPHCEGRGCFFLHASFKQGKITLMRCDICKGEGSVDWITFARFAGTKPNLTRTRMFKKKEIRFKCQNNCKVIKRWVKEERKRSRDPDPPWI
jgi:hypothetical protein